MSGYPEFFEIVYRDDQRIMILNENPEKRVEEVKKKAVRNMAEEASVEPILTKFMPIRIPVMGDYFDK